MDPFEQAAVASLAHWEEKGSGYFKQQSTRPQTLGYGLADSPVGQAAWIYEKTWAWTDNQGNPEDALTLDEMLDVYPRETLRPSRRWVDRWMPNLIHYNILERGGHFAAWEQSALHAKEIRDCFAKVR